MAEAVNEESCTQSVEQNSNGQQSPSGDALVEWRSSDQVENGVPSTTLSYWDSDDDDDHGPKPSKLYERHTWKIDKFSEINKRELRSSAFEVGGYKWYILIYPQGCDVCNHLSLFLCVANHDKLLPGWSHFAQFTIAVVNRDPKKSKYSDTLHRFWKKEHDWGWKKFMELPKLQDGFIDDSDSLVIKAQVQVIRERPDRPFRCLDCQYRRELVRVYLTNVEQICRRFVEERRSKLGRLIEDKARWTSFCAFWLGLDQNCRRRMSREKTGVILKVVVKHFFIEKEVTSTLVMDSLYSGLKALEGQAKNKKRKPRLVAAEELPAPIVSVDKDMFVLVDDVLLLLERAALQPLPPKDDKGPQNRTKDGNAGEEFNKEAIERDERRLTELGRRTVEIFVLAHIFSNKIEAAYQEAIALKRQEELIREEELAWLAESEQRAKRGAEKEKKSKKKQAKQKRNKNKGKDKRKEEKASYQIDEKDIEETLGEDSEKKEEEVKSVIENLDTREDVSDISDSVDGSAEVLRPDSEERDRDCSPVHPTTLKGDSSRGKDSSMSLLNGGAERKYQTLMDDTSSTCSNDSIRSGSHRGNILDHRNHKSSTKGKNQQGKVASEADDQPSKHASSPRNQSRASDGPKEGNMAMQMKQNSVNSVDMDRPKERSTAVLSSPRSAPRNPSSLFPTRKLTSNGLHSSDQLMRPVAEMQRIAAPKRVAQPTPSISRPSSAPIIPPQRQPASSAVSVVQTATSLARSASSAGRLGPEPLPKTQTFTPQSYKSAIVGNTGGSSSFNQSSTSATVASPLPPPISAAYQSSFPFSLGSRDGSTGGQLWTGGSSSCQRDRVYTSAGGRGVEHTVSNDVEMRRQAQSLVTDEFPHLDIINDLLDDEHGMNGRKMSGSGFHVPHQQFNSNRYAYQGADLRVSGELLSCRPGYPEGTGYGHFDSHGVYMMMPNAATSPYANNRQMDGLMQTQWQMGNMDLSLQPMRAPDDPFFASESSNPWPYRT